MNQYALSDPQILLPSPTFLLLPPSNPLAFPDRLMPGPASSEDTKAKISKLMINPLNDINKKTGPL